MKQLIKISTLVLTASLLMFASCKKKKNEPDPTSPPTNNPVNEPEVITTLRIYLWDSITNTAVAGSPFSFKDPDGDGGIAGGFLNNGADSLITLSANTSYKTRLVILDETKNPVDSISNHLAGEESYEHMVFYNGNPANTGNNNGNTILKGTYPNYSVKLNGSGIRIRYTDSDNGTEHGQPTRNTGLETVFRTENATSGSFSLIITLKHQPDGKDGSYAPGETDVEVAFRVKVN